MGPTQSQTAGTGRFGRLGFQLIAATLLVLSLVLLLTSAHTIESEQRLLSDQLDARGRALARLGATSCVELYLGSDYPRIDTIVEQIAEQDPDVVYSRAEKADGETIRESFVPGDGRSLEMETCRRYVADVIWDPQDGATPAQTLGRIELGLSTQRLATLKAERTRVLAFEALLAFVGMGLLLSYFLRRKVVEPLEMLDLQAQALGRGDLETPVRCAARNEIGRLAATLDGMRINLQHSYTEVRERNEELMRVGAAKDQALDDLAEALDAAHTAARTKDEFLATVSHELRTPLNGILGMTDVLAATQLTPEQRECFETVQISAESLLVVVNDVLDFSKLGESRLELVPVPVDLRTLAADACAPFRPAVRAKGISLSWHVDDDVPARLRADPVRVRQVLTNLLGNAVKFTERGGVRLEFGVESRDATHVELRGTVIDTGIGIPLEARGRLFQPFSQADGSITRRFGGTGLGLVIAQRLCEQMGGSVGYESEAGIGSRFTFRVRLEVLPDTSEAAAAPRTQAEEARARVASRAPVEPPESAAAAPPAPLPARPARVSVLLVEDNAVNQRVAAKMLRKLGCEVEVVENGAEALERSAGGQFALVLMDLSMPVMDGLEATRRIRQRERGTARRVPIVALTANAVNGDRERCLEAGMDGYLAKPVRVEGLADVIGRFCQPGSVAQPQP